MNAIERIEAIKALTMLLTFIDGPDSNYGKEIQPLREMILRNLTELVSGMLI